ncbi:hypothetical protein [Prauserella sp. PE36]|uniref:hypothetical protein n=1 Tax=Prauserella sp. PE36 TaxID=1504709 RepID=UPI0011BF603A|nr:hypothetical protein [Prauserella sp. PE36]
MRTPIWKTFIALEGECDTVITDPPERVLEVMVIDGLACMAVRPVDEHDNIGDPIATFDVDVDNLVTVLRAGVTASPYPENKAA